MVDHIEVEPTLQEEFDQIKGSMETLEEEALPILEDISVHTRRAKKAVGDDNHPADTLTLSNEIVELAILNQRLSDRISMMGYTLRGATNLYERTRENHKVRLVQVGEERIVDGKKKFVTVAAGVADSMKLELAKKEFELFNQCTYRMNQYTGSYKALDKTIDTLRSKISYEKSNERNA